MFTLSNFIEIYHFYFDDPDNAVDKGTITVKLYSVSEASLVETRMIKTNTEYESLRFNNLKMDTDYRIEFTAQNYNVYYDSGKNETNYTFADPDRLYVSTGAGVHCGCGIRMEIFRDGYVKRPEEGTEERNIHPALKRSGRYGR